MPQTSFNIVAAL